MIQIIDIEEEEKKKDENEKDENEEDNWCATFNQNPKERGIKLVSKAKTSYGWARPHSISQILVGKCNPLSNRIKSGPVCHRAKF